MRRGLLVIVPVLIFLAVLGAARLAGSVDAGSSQERNPFADQGPATWARSAAATAAEAAAGPDREVLERIAGVPTAVWVTPEAHPTAEVADFVMNVVESAGQAERTPVLVVYGITDRDCIGGESSGGLPADEYVDWVGRIADVAGDRAAVVLEPDALATAADCDQLEERTRLLGDAVDRLVDAGPAVYVDAGHSSWTDPSDMAAMLKAVGVERTRGFSTNVSGYESDADETTYATEVSRALGGAHFVIDTGRNGAGSNGEWCNPTDRALGQEPHAGSGGILDAYLWIKPPGESDGTCGGGPGAGEFWTERALELAANAGW